MKNKAQIFGEPFIFIFSIVVAAMVLIFGIKIYYDLSQRADFAQIADVTQRINEDITTFYNLEIGSQNTFTFKLPSSIDCFCFLDSPKSLVNIPDRCNTAYFKNKIESETASNVVLWKYNDKTIKGNNPANLPERAIIRSVFVTTTNAQQNNPLCIDLVSTQHNLKIRLTSKGDSVLVENIQ